MSSAEKQQLWTELLEVWLLERLRNVMLEECNNLHSNHGFIYPAEIQIMGTGKHLREPGLKIQHTYYHEGTECIMARRTLNS